MATINNHVLFAAGREKVIKEELSKPFALSSKSKYVPSFFAAEVIGCEALFWTRV